MAFPKSAAAGHKLDDEHRTFIVTQLAMFLTPQQVADAVKDRFGIVIDRRNVAKYDPTQKVAKQMARKWRELYHEVRERFLADVSEIPIANRSMRLRQLQHHYDRAVDRQNVKLATAILEQAAKEVGGIHTNERRVHLDGKIKTDRPVSEDEMRALIADRLAEEWDKLRQASNDNARAA